MKAIILSGGLGTRLRNVVKDVPKPMAPIGERPFLDYVLASLHGAPISEVVIAAGYKATAIANYFAEKPSNLPVRVVVENKPLGTGGAFRQVCNTFDSSEFVLAMNGDTINLVDFAAFCDCHPFDADMRLLLRKVENTKRYGRANIHEGKIFGFEEKTEGKNGWINGGVYLFRAGILQDKTLPDSFSFETEYLEKRIADLKVDAYFSDSYFLDIGIPEDYERGQRELPEIMNV